MDQQTLYIVMGCVLLVGLVCYIIALVKSKSGEMVFTTSGWDMALLLTCPVLVLVGSFMQENPSLDTARYILWTIAGVCFAGTIVFSVISNKESVWKILCSIMAKIFVIWLTIFVIFLLITIFIAYVILSLIRGHNEEGEYILLKYDNFLKAYVGYRI